MGAITDSGFDSMMTEDEREQRDNEIKRERESMERKVTVDGVEFQVKELFPNTYEAREFSNKLDLMAKVRESNNSDPAENVQIAAEVEKDLLGGPDAD